MIIRPAQPHDLEPLLPLYHALYETLGGYGLPYTLERDGLKRTLSAFLSSRHCRVSLAVEGEEIVGFLASSVLRMERKFTYRGTSSLGMIHDLYVNPACRGQSVARHLLADAEQWLQSQGVLMVQCHVVSGNEEGAAFWTLHGYDAISTLRAKSLCPPKEDLHVVSPE